MLKNLFKLDLRSLALARFLLGILAFFDIARRIPDLNHFFTDQGMLPRWVLLEQFELKWRMSLLTINGSYAFALMVALIGMLAAILFTLGWRTRISNFIVWITIISFQARFPEGATSGGDMLLRIFLFLSIFLPMNARYSIDKSLGQTEIKENEFFSVFSSMWIIQVTLLYIFTFLFKWAPVYHTDFDAVWYMLQLDIFTTPIGKWLGQYYFVTKVLSFVSYSLEIIGPLLLLIPFKRDFFRGLAVLAFWSFHLGIGLTLHLGNFVPICLIIWVGLIPTVWWDYLFEKVKETVQTQKELLKKFGRIRTYISRESGELTLFLDNNKHASEMVIPKTSVNNFLKSSFAIIGFDKVKNHLNKFEKFLGGLLLALMIGWNVEGYVENRKWYIGSPFDEIMFTFQLNQGWAMFAPHPQRSDGWWVMEGVKKDGSKWDAYNNKEVNFNRPVDIYATYPSEDWRKFLDNLQATRNDNYLMLLSKHLCRSWNAQHLGESALNTFQLYYMQEFTTGPKEPPAKIKKIKLWNHSCF